MRRPDGQEGIYAYLEKYPGVYVIAEDDDGGIFLIREYRYVIGKIIWQLPSGAIPDEDPVSGAVRELFEETGMTATSVEKLGGLYQGSGHETTYVHIFKAKGLDKSGLSGDKQEGDESILEVRKVMPDELLMMIRNNEIECAVTMAGIGMYLALRNSG